MNQSLKRSLGKNYKQREILPPIKQPYVITMNNQRRKKLSQSLTKSLIDKYKDKNYNSLIESEVNEFLKRENISQNNLKDLEKLISKKIKIKKEQKDLTEKLIKSTKPIETNLTEEKKDNLTKENNEEAKNQLNVSGMSGGSDLDKFDGKMTQAEIQNKEMEELEKFKKNNNQATIKKVELDTNKYNDEWDAINMYNKKMFEERKRLEKEKEWEMKMRNRADLLNQIKQKIKRKYEQEIKDKEYGETIKKNVKKMEEVEKKRKDFQKQQAMIEKEIRDKQLHDIYVAKRIAYLKNKKYEKELIEHNNNEIRLEKEVEQERKKKEHEALLKTLKDNELHKQKLLEQEKNERENDIKIMEDSIANEIKKENERKAYYESIKRGQMEHDTKMLESVIKERDEKLAEEDKMLKNYLMTKDMMEKEKEEKLKIEKKEKQMMLRKIYDQQIKTKKAKLEFEKQVDLAQGKIWEQDYKNYINYQNEINRRIKELSKQNILALENQVKYGKNCIDSGMSETEKEMNKDLIEKANAL